ncbi:MAG: class I SAM-dependent methyltransferase [Chloroflexia bacterium]|nr:class I SAM-dependent methyltransferase [Chloroflexia bacterium]
MVSPELFKLLRCPTCGDGGLLLSKESQLRCVQCGQAYPLYSGYVDLLPRGTSFAHTSHYVSAEEAFAEALDYRSLGPPLLAAGVRQHELQRLLRLGPDERVLDCGCGNAKFTLWNHDAAKLVGLDPASLFADAALAQVDLVQGDARQPPFVSGSFDKAFSIDVFEHLTREDIAGVLDQLHRLLRPGGRLLIYSNTREPSSLQPVVNLWRRLGRWLRRRGLTGPDVDAIRKADHIKAIATYEELVQVMAEHGFRVVRVRFWNSVLTSFVEHVLMPLAERRREAPAPTAPEALASVRSEWRQQAARRGWLYWAARVLTWIMGWDLTLFGRLRSGSYFLLLEREAAA